MLTASCALVTTADIAIVKLLLAFYTIIWVGHSSLFYWCLPSLSSKRPYKLLLHTHFLPCLSTFDFSWVDLFKRVNSPAQQITYILLSSYLTLAHALATRERRASIYNTSKLQNYYVTLAGEERARESAAHAYFIRTAPCVARACGSMRT